MSRNGADILIKALMAGGVDTIFGLPGDGINGAMEARTRPDDIKFIQVRHEESATFPAVAHATTAPGGVHLLNGLYEAKPDREQALARGSALTMLQA